jgi:hypothetical protein
LRSVDESAFDFRTSCRAKVERADEHIQTLQSECEAYLQSEPKPYRIVRQPQEGGLGFVWKGFESWPPPPIIPILAGEVIHQLRSSLDHLVTGMVLERGNKITKDHGFPITEKPERFNNARDRTLQGISLAAQQLIESLQPYNSPGGHASSILWTLHRQDIEDKHKLLIVVSAGVFTESVTVDNTAASGTTNIQMATLGPIQLTKEGVELLRLTTPEAKPGLNPDAQFAPVTAFEEFGSVKLNPVVKALSQARDFVIQTINQFAAEFSTRGDDVGVGSKSHLRPLQSTQAPK